MQGYTTVRRHRNRSRIMHERHVVRKAAMECVARDGGMDAAPHKSHVSAAVTNTRTYVCLMCMCIMFENQEFKKTLVDTIADLMIVVS